MQKTIKIAIVLIAVLAAASVIALNMGIATNTPQTNPSPTPDVIITPYPSSDASASATPSATPVVSGNFTLIEIKEPTEKGTEYVFVWYGPASTLTIYKDDLTFTQSIEDGNEISITFKSTLKIEAWPRLLIDIQL